MKFLLFLWLFTDIPRLSLHHPVLEGDDITPNEPADENGMYFEADIILTEHQKKEIQLAKLRVDDETGHRQKRKAVSDIALLWPDGRVPYLIESSLDIGTSALIRQAIDHWQEHTCLQFTEYNEYATDIPRSHVRFIKGSGCWAHLGRLGENGAQGISIGNGCEYFGIILHEIGHCIGFLHEHRRPDRDQYITVHYESIIPQRRVHFDRYDIGISTDLGVPYDLESIMHYGTYAFSQYGAKTITTKNPADQLKIGQRSGLSSLDILLANRLYNCPVGDCPSLLCQNGGYVGSNCECVCPWPYSGTLCEIDGNSNIPAPLNCVEMLTADRGEIISPNYPSFYPHNQECTWTLQVLPGQKIAFIFEDFELERSSYLRDPCRYDSVTLRNMDDPPDGGFKYCGYQLPPCFTSTGHQMEVVFVSDFSEAKRGFKAWYAAISSRNTCTNIVSDGAVTPSPIGGIRLPTTAAVNVPPTPVLCQEIFTRPKGSFTSPGYPDNYFNNLNCQWTIQAPSEYRIKLTFNDFEVYRSGRDQIHECLHDYVEILLGSEWDTPARICGGGPNGMVISTSSTLVVTFTTDVVNTFGGFSANYEFIRIN